PEHGGRAARRPPAPLRCRCDPFRRRGRGRTPRDRGEPRDRTPRALMSTLSEHVDLDLTGMSCASCAARVEATLNKLEGVTATVNFATEKASVDFDASEVSPPELVAAVTSIGYGATVAPPVGGHQHSDLDDRGVRALRNRVVASAMLAGPVVVI